MFWGLIMEPGKKYSQTVQKSFHISHAALDLDTAANEPVQVLLGFDNRNYLMCTLQKAKWIQENLDLNFQVGDTVSFATNGPGHVHLTGYLVPEDDFGMDEEDDGEDEESDEEVPELVPAGKKRKSEEKNAQASKKSRTIELLEAIKDEDTDDSEDSDVNLTDMLEDEESGEEEEDDDEEGGEEEEDDDEEDGEADEDSDDEEEEEEIEVPQKQSKKEKKEALKQNGVVSKRQEKRDKKEKQAQQQNDKQQKGDKSPKPKSPGKEGNTPNKRIVEGGVIVEEIKVGDGNIAKSGKVVQVYYEGRLKTNNKMFDSSTKGPGFKFRLGRQEVIKGWDVGLAGMKVGGKRRITCPPNMAYGAQGSPPVIPPGSTLIFEVELKNVKN